MKIDFHTHIISEKLPNMAAKYGGERWPILERTCSCRANILVAGKVFREITNQAWDPIKRLEDMDREGIDKQVISPIPVTFCYFAPVQAAVEMCMFQNEFIAETAATHPNRFMGLGTVPLQNPDAAIQEMQRLTRELGLKGVEIGTNVNGKNLDDPSLLPFFRMAAEWSVPLFIHPWETLGRDRMPRHNFTYTIGMPSETALAAASFTWGGVIEKFPNLKVCFAHGGGSFAYLLPRLDKGWEVWPQLRVTPHPPSYYAARVYFDSLVYDPAVLRFLIDRFGLGKLIAGSDYPFLLRESPSTIVGKMEGLGEEDKRMILGQNALNFLNLT